jgi:YggT family protein
MAGVAYALVTALQIYVYLIIVWTFGSFFPAWRFQEWYRFIDRVVAPFVELFAPLRLQFSGMDFTPLAAIIAVQIFRFIVIAAVERGLA